MFNFIATFTGLQSSFIMSSPNWKQSSSSTHTLDWRSCGRTVFVSGILPSWRPGEAPPRRWDDETPDPERGAPSRLPSQNDLLALTNKHASVQPGRRRTCFELGLCGGEETGAGKHSRGDRTSELGSVRALVNIQTKAQGVCLMWIHAGGTRLSSNG